MIADADMRVFGTDYPVSITCSEVLKFRKMFDCLMHEMPFIIQLKYNVTVHSVSSICVYVFFIFTLCHVNNIALNTYCNLYSSIVSTPKRRILYDSFFLI